MVLERKASFTLIDLSCCPYAWMLCLNVLGLTHPHIHPYTLTYSYRQIHASVYTLTYTHLPHTHITIFKFYYSSIPVSLIKLTVSLYFSTVWSFLNTS